MRLVTFEVSGGERVGELRDETIVELDAPTMREYFERGGAAATGVEHGLADVRLRAPIVPKKFFHTAGNFREHHEESKQVSWSHDVAPWIMFFQNVDAIVGPDEPVVYPEHLTEELDYELELAVVIGKPGKWFSPEEAMDYVAGYVIFNDITARDIQRARCVGRLFVLQGDRHVLPARAVDRHARRGARPARPEDGAARQRRGRGRCPTPGTCR